MKISKKEAFSIPNIMGYFRIILIPVFLYVYYNATSVKDYYVVAGIVCISGITDFLDGFIARKFNMITEWGKFIDPLADKLTQAALVFALSFKYKLMWYLVGLFIVKEGFMAIMGIIMLRKDKKLDGAKWFGKLCTAILYIVMFMLMLFQKMNNDNANLLILVCGVFMLMSFILYMPVFYRMHKSSK
ncbi:CDP-alcohol phosphatidyltransferase family protein [Terrisporobacter petrolearius]|uniref:CDP-alcohol phosphatidyltransferase family protein n=1 Tax=Terrisporobacter petrolearius TaxID=1460447 RepID=UPI003B00DF99